MTEFKVGDRVNTPSENAGNGTIVAIGKRQQVAEVCVMWGDGSLGVWDASELRLVTDPPPAPPKPVPPACGYWKCGDVMLHDPVWREVRGGDYYLFGQEVQRWPVSAMSFAPVSRWCLSVLTLPEIPACGYWEHHGKRYALTEPVEYRITKPKEQCLCHGGVWFGSDTPAWILCEVPVVRRWIKALSPVAMNLNYTINAPLIDTGSGPHLDVDKIGREWAIKWLEDKYKEQIKMSWPIHANNAANYADMLRREQEADHDAD